MKTVYLLESISYPKKRYIGITTHLEQRLAEHNAGKSPYTSSFKPWKCVVAINFENSAKAEAFEKYLKQGTGHAFARRHFW
jgi:predicted GIY-YIG superfamily endonuclease